MGVFTLCSPWYLNWKYSISKFAWSRIYYYDSVFWTWLCTIMIPWAVSAWFKRWTFCWSGFFLQTLHSTPLVGQGWFKMPGERTGYCLFCNPVIQWEIIFDIWHRESRSLVGSLETWPAQISLLDEEFQWCSWLSTQFHCCCFLLCSSWISLLYLCFMSIVQSWKDSSLCSSCPGCSESASLSKWSKEALIHQTGAF